MTQDELTMEQKTLLWGGPQLAAVGSGTWMACRDLQAKGLMIQGTRCSGGEAASDMFHLTRKGLEMHAELRAAGGGIRPPDDSWPDPIKDPREFARRCVEVIEEAYRKTFGDAPSPASPSIPLNDVQLDGAALTCIPTLPCPDCGEEADCVWWTKHGRSHKDGRDGMPQIRIVCCHRKRHKYRRPAPSLQVDVVPANPGPPASRWVPVEERLPEPGATVKVLRDFEYAGKEASGETFGGARYWEDDNINAKPVTHWLEEVMPPLPERPKKVEEKPPGKWIRWGIGECRNRARTGEHYVGVSVEEGKLRDLVRMAGIRGEEHFADIQQGGRAVMPSPAWIIREEDFLALCPGPWSDGKGEA